MSKGTMAGLSAPQLTPFNADGSVNYHEYTRLTEYLVQNGADGIFVCGTSGEFANLTVGERKELLLAAQQGAAADTMLLYNVTALNLNDIRELCEFAIREKADAVSLTPPYYHGYDAPALIAYFRQCIRYTGDLPVYLYNIPGMVRNAITPQILREVCATCHTVRGIKDSSMDFMTFLGFQRAAPDADFEVVTGNDAQVLTALQAGGRGAVIAMAGVYPALCKSIFTYYQNGDLQAARRAQDTVMDLRALVRSVMPVMAHKEILKTLGFDMGPARFPFRELTDAEHVRMHVGLKECGLA